MRGVEWTVRALAATDSAATEQLCHATFTRDRSAGDIARIVTRLDHVGIVAESKGAVVGFCVGSRSRFGSTEDAHLDVIVVDAQRRRQGIARALLASLETQFARVGCTKLRIEGNAPSYPWAGVDVHYTEGLCFVERMAFTRGPSAISMDVDLSTNRFGTSTAERELARKGFSFRRATARDLEALYSLKARWPARWIPQLAFALQGAESGVFLAEQNGDCVGFCAFGANRLHEIGPLGIDERVRRQGIGAVLLRLCCAQQRSLGLEHAELQWAGPLGYFADVLQAKTSRVFWRYAKPLQRQDGGGVCRDRPPPARS